MFLRFIYEDFYMNLQTIPLDLHEKIIKII